MFAATNRTVIDNFTPSANTASSRARVDTLLIKARLRERTLGADHTFRSTSRWTSYVIREARTNGLFVNFATLTVGPARAGLARVCRSFRLYKKLVTKKYAS